jgi:hypothetical protein
MTRTKRILWVLLFVLGGLTGVSAKASAKTQWPWWYCRECHIPEVCYPGNVCDPQGTGRQCSPELPNCNDG